MRRATAILCAALSAAAQRPVPDAGGLKFTATSQLVIEIVTVTDRTGKPIGNLNAADFVITENDVLQAIKVCEFQKLPGAGEGLPALKRRETAATEGLPEPQSEIRPEAPGDLRYRDRRLIVLYFDMSTMPVPDQLRAFAGARKFFLKQMSPADLVAMMQFQSGAVKVLQDFTDNRELLGSVLEKLILASEGVESKDADMAADTDTAFGQDDGEFNLFNTDRQLAALQTAVQMLGTVSERKALIYFSSGIRLNGVDNQAQLRATLNSAVRANVAFYPVDARGLVAEAPLGDATRASQGGIGMYTGAAAMARAGMLQHSQDTLFSLAADTGGKATFDNNDLAMGIVAAQQSMSSYYVLGYYTTNTAKDGKFRRIKVSLKEYESAKLEYRQGYFAQKEFSKSGAADKERMLEEALMSGDPITDLTIAAELNYFQLNRAEYFVPVVVKIPGSELALARKRGAERTVIEFVGEIKDEANVTVQNLRDKMDIRLSNQSAAELVKRHIQYDSGYTLLPGTYWLKLLARDDVTGRIGTYLTRFTIPNLNKVTDRIAISSVVLSGQRIDLKDALYTAGKDKTQVTHPLVDEGQKLVPSVTRVFRKSRELYIYLQAYNQTAKTAPPLATYVTFYKGSTKAFETAPLKVSDALPNRLKTMPVRWSLELARLPAGRYTVQVTVLDPAGPKAAFWSAPILLVP